MTDIIYFDKDICVCVKPRGVLSEGEGQTSLPLLLEGELRERGVSVKVYTVHRLDKETEGLMVYALSQRAAAELSRQIREGELEKEYVAELCGVPKESEGELCDLLFYDRTRGRSYVVTRERKGVKEARLAYHLLESDGVYSRVRVKLYTGRTHQIRAQFASRKMPLRGDRRYGAGADSGEFSLRSCYLRFRHPVSGEMMEFER
ncbi:MAG: RluA family pseudouridine synthase [Clostridia bacterium]|nr:RluA family pseudouridine synthase [Clostridia bacterium]